MTPDFHEEEAIGKVYDRELLARMWPYHAARTGQCAARSIALIPISVVLEVMRPR